jgi:hypothetical protein
MPHVIDFPKCMANHSRHSTNISPKSASDDYVADPRKNRLLLALPEPELQRWLPHLEYVDMRLGEVLPEAGSA